MGAPSMDGDTGEGGWKWGWPVCWGVLGEGGTGRSQHLGDAKSHGGWGVGEAGRGGTGDVGPLWGRGRRAAPAAARGSPRGRAAAGPDGAVVPARPGRGGRPLRRPLRRRGAVRGGGERA